MSEQDLTRTHEVGLALDAYLRNALGVGNADEYQLAQSPKPGVLGRIALDANESVTDDDRVSLAFILLAAGFETTAMLVANAMHLLLESPVEWTTLAANPVRASLVVEETLRLQAPAVLTTRFVRAHTIVGTLAVQPQTSIAMLLAAANRDPEKFTNPAAFDPSRYDTDRTAHPTGTSQPQKATPPLSFGSACIIALVRSWLAQRQLPCFNGSPFWEITIASQLCNR